MIDLVTTLLELAAVIVLAVGAALTVSALVSGPTGVGLGVLAAGENASGEEVAQMTG